MNKYKLLALASVFMIGVHLYKIIFLNKIEDLYVLLLFCGILYFGYDNYKRSVIE